MQVEIKDNQSLLDIAIQYCGSAEAAYQFAVLNGLSVTDDLQKGNVLAAPAVVNVDIARYYANRALTPATAEPGVDDYYRLFFIAAPIELP